MCTAQRKQTPAFPGCPPWRLPVGEGQLSLWRPDWREGHEPQQTPPLVAWEDRCPSAHPNTGLFRKVASSGIWKTLWPPQLFQHKHGTCATSPHHLPELICPPLLALSPPSHLFLAWVPLGSPQLLGLCDWLQEWQKELGMTHSGALTRSATKQPGKGAGRGM